MAVSELNKSTERAFQSLEPEPLIQGCEKNTHKGERHSTLIKSLETHSEKPLKSRKSRSDRKKRSEGSVNSQSQGRQKSKIKYNPPTAHMQSKNPSSIYGTGIEESNALDGTGSKSYHTAPSHPQKERTSAKSSHVNTAKKNSGTKHAKTGSIDDLRAQIARRSQGSKLNSSAKKRLNSSTKKRELGSNCSFQQRMSFKNGEDQNCKNLNQFSFGHLSQHETQRPSLDPYQMQKSVAPHSPKLSSGGSKGRKSRLTPSD